MIRIEAQAGLPAFLALFLSDDKIPVNQESNHPNLLYCNRNG